MQTPANLILASPSEAAERFNLISYFEDCERLTSLFNELQQECERFMLLVNLNGHACESYIHTLLAGSCVSEESFGEAQQDLRSQSGSFLKSLWVRIKNIFLAVYQTIKTFFKRLFDVNIRNRKKLLSLMNDFSTKASPAVKNKVVTMTLTLVPYRQYVEIIDNLNTVYSKISRVGMSGNVADVSEFNRQGLDFFNIVVKNGEVYTTVDQLKPVPVATNRLDYTGADWGWSSNGDPLATLQNGTRALVEVLINAEKLNINSTGLENECAAALRKIDQLSASGRVEDAIRTQDELYGLQRRANYVVSINKLYQAYVSQLCAIMTAAWVNVCSVK